MFTDFRIKFNRFWRKNKYLILIIIVVWAIIIAVNYFLASLKKEQGPQTSYNPHTSVMDSSSKVPTKQQESIENAIDKFIRLCNEKNYEEAYALLSQECKDYMYTTKDEFKEYVDGIFDTEKRYSIQNYSNIDNMYIYQVKIFDDILSTGLTNTVYSYTDERFTITHDSAGEVKLSVGKFIAKKDIKSVAEDDFLKIDIQSKLVTYDSEIYTIKITNRSDYVVVVADGEVNAEEVLLDLGGEYRSQINAISDIILYSGQSKTYNIEFTKFYDDGDTSKAIVFNAIRVLKSYNGQESATEEALENAVKKYSLKIKVY